MAKRPIFIPATTKSCPFVQEIELEFQWFPGFSLKQIRKSIASLHESARQRDYFPLLEISTKSPDSIGVRLSAFNLTLELGNRRMSVENAYQGSKVFADGGPYRELYEGSSQDAKRDERLRLSGEVEGFDLLGTPHPTEPRTAFYHWLYLSALRQNVGLAEKLRDYYGFTDIAFNPSRSLNCQARSAALYVSLSARPDFDDMFNDQTGATFYKFVRKEGVERRT